MELKDFINVLKNNWKLIISTSLLFLVAAIAVTYIIPVSYVASIDVYVTRRAIEESESYYTYDGYYSTQSSVQYTDTVSGLFQTLQVVREAASEIDLNKDYQKSEKEPSDLSSDTEYLKDTADKITVEDVAPQVISVSFKDEDQKKAEIWVTSLGEVVQEKVSVLNKDSDGNFRIDISPNPLVTEVSPSFVINSIVGLMFGLLTGTLVSFGKIYFKNSK
jgi:capsular polysaccharide biosynthesis protein